MSSSGSVPTEEDRSQEEELLRTLAGQLRTLSSTTAGADHAASIQGFATQAESYADQIRDAPTPEQGVAIAMEISGKRTQWIELMQMLTLATQVEGKDNIEATEDIENMAGIGELIEEEGGRLRRTAESLRELSNRGGTAVFNAIGTIAAEAEGLLVEFAAAETTMNKVDILGRFEESRDRWRTRMNAIHATIADADGNESEASTEVNDPTEPACEYVEDNVYASCMEAVGPSGGLGAFSAFGGFGGSGCAISTSASSSLPVAGSSDSPAPPVAGSSDSPAPEPASAASASRVAMPAEAVAPSTPEEAREHLVKYLKDENEGLLVTLRKAVAKVKEDERFESVHADAAKLLEQMELAAGAVIPDALMEVEFSDDVAGAEDRLKATIEPMRKAQWGGFYAKQAAMQVRKYDLYKARGSMPKLAVEHPDLMECAEVSVQLGEYLRKTAQDKILDSVTGLVAQTMR